MCIISLSLHNTIKREKVLAPLCRRQSWGLESWTTELNQVFLALTDTGLHWNLAEERQKHTRLPKSPWTHTCNMLCFVNHQTQYIKEKQKCLISGNKRPGRGISLQHFYLQLGSTRVEASGWESRTWKSGKTSSGSDLPSLTAFITGRQRDGTYNVLLEVAGVPEERGSVTLASRTQIGTIILE